MLLEEFLTNPNIGQINALIDGRKLVLRGLETANIEDLNALGEALRGSNITSLYLNNNHLYIWDEEQITAFMQGLQGSNITTLNWRGNHDHRWNMIIHSHITASNEQIRVFAAQGRFLEVDELIDSNAALLSLLSRLRQ